MDKKSAILACGLAIGVDRAAIQRRSGIAPRTFDRRMANPNTITLDEFRHIVGAAGIPDETIIKLVKER